MRIHFSIELDIERKPKDEMPRYDNSSTVASSTERAPATHIGFAPPEWPEDGEVK